MGIKRLLLGIFNIFLFLSRKLQCPDPTCSFDNCFDCSACGDETGDCYCNWNPNNKVCTKTSTQVKLSSTNFWNIFDKCIDNNSKETQNKNCGYYDVKLNDDKATINLKNINGVYGFQNIFCEYRFLPDSNDSPYQFKVEINSQYSNDIILYIIITYQDDTESAGILKKNLDKELVEVKQILIKFYSSRSFYESPFNIEINKKKKKASYGIYIAIGVIILGCILC